MSVICALRRDGETWVGSDTSMVDGSLRSYSGPKWVLHEGWAVGFTGDLRSGNLVGLNKSELLTNLVPEAFPDRLREVLKAKDYNTDNEPGAPNYGVTLLLANAGNIWSVCSGLSLSPVKNFWAEGSGRQLALGAAFAASGTAEEIVLKSIEAAIQYDTGCGGEPWTFHVK